MGLTFCQHGPRTLCTTLTSNSIDIARGVALTIPEEIPLSDQPVRTIRYAYCWINPTCQSVMVPRLFDKMVLENVLSVKDFLISVHFALYGITGPNTGLVFDSYLIQVIIWINKDTLFVILCLYFGLLLQWLEATLDNLLTTQKKKKTWRVSGRLEGGFLVGFWGDYLYGIGVIKWL